MRTGTTIRQIYMPYVIAVLGNGEFLPLNRFYKPIGVSSETWVKYETYPTRLRIKGLTDAKAKQIGMEVSKSGDDSSDTMYYLYEDATNPSESKANWDRYQGILAKLIKLEADSVEP